jgi:hypothetical protein
MLGSLPLATIKRDSQQWTTIFFKHISCILSSIMIEQNSGKVNFCFFLQTKIETVKERLRTHCGTAVASMVLQLFDESGRKVADLSEDQRVLGYYSPADG